MLLIVTDNGSNIVKAVRLLGDRRREQNSESEDGDVSQAQPRRAGDGQDEVSQTESVGRGEWRPR